MHVQGVMLSALKELSPTGKKMHTERPPSLPVVSEITHQNSETIDYTA